VTRYGIGLVVGAVVAVALGGGVLLIALVEISARALRRRPGRKRA
jgi:hypothetical protein